MDDKLGVTVQEIKNFGQFLFEGRGALQEFVGETMDGESLGMDLTITWIEIALEIAWICRSRDLDHCDFDDAIAFLRFEAGGFGVERSEEHTSELQSLMRTSYAVFCLKKKNN